VENIGTSLGRMLVVFTPGFEHFWLERAHLMATFGDQVDPELLLALQDKYHADMGGRARQYSNA